MRRKDIRLLSITSALLMLVGCTRGGTSASDTGESLVAPESSSVLSSFEVEYILFDHSVIRTTYQDGEMNLYPEVEQNLTSEQIDYVFSGWDYTGDGKVDEGTFEVHSGATCYAVYEIAPEITITYTCDQSENQITIQNNTDFSLPVPTEKPNFVYYMDENGYPYTDKNGKKLKNVDLQRSVTLTPFFMEREKLPFQAYLTDFPSLRVKGEEEKRLLKAIEENKVTVDESDANHLTLDDVQYQRVITENKGNIFHDYTRCEYGHTYYFRYTPLKWDVSSFEESPTYGLQVHAATSDIVQYHVPRAASQRDMFGDTRIYLESSPSPELSYNLGGITILDLYVSTEVFYRVPSDDLIMEKMKIASDYVIAAMPIEISYEKGTMFHIEYSIGDLVNTISVSDEVYIRDFNGEKKKVVSGLNYGELLEFKFSPEKLRYSL